MHIVICDDHAFVADGIAMLLRQLDSKVRVQLHLDADSLMTAAPTWTDVDLVLLDLVLSQTDDLSTLERLRSCRDDVPVVMVSGFASRQQILRAIDLGAMGFIPKSSSTAAMMKALRIVLDGGVYLPPGDMHYRESGTAVTARELALTPRQWQILHRVLQGKPVKRIANELNIAESTVKTHLTPILRELGATTRTEAIARAVTMGLRFPSGSCA